MPPFERDPAGQDNPGFTPVAKRPVSRTLKFGLLLVALGVLALVFPFVSTLAATLFLGGIFLVAGLAKMFNAFSDRSGSRVTKALWGLAYMIGGGLMLYAPLSGAWSLTIVLAALFVAGGAASIAWALSNPKPHGWAWMAASGVASILLGGLVALALPYAGFWFPGVVAGIDLITTGVALIAMDRTGRAALLQTDIAATP